MKSILLLSAVLLSSGVNANTLESVFKKDSPLTEAAKTAILNQIQKDCPSLVTMWTLKEIKTEAKRFLNANDDEVVLYKSVFSSTYYPDGMHPAPATITAVTVSDYITYHIKLESPEGCR